MIQFIAVAAVGGLLLGGFLGHQYASGQAAKKQVRAITAEEVRRLNAYDSLARSSATITGERDKAVADLEAVRAQRPLTLIKTVTKTVEVPSGATTVDCHDSSVGPDFARVWNDAASAYNAMTETNGDEDAK